MDVPDELEFEAQDLTGAVFWDVVLRDATFRDVDLSGSRVSHSRLVDVSIDALVDRLVVNGVDVTAFVNEHDRWYPLRTMLRPEDPASMRDSWAALQAAWSPVVVRATAMSEAALRASVGGEWSFVQTLRHLAFAMDKWFTGPVLGEPLDPAGLPNTGSADFPWPELDREANPSVADVLAVRERRSTRFGDVLATVTPDELDREVDVLENGRVTVRQCVHVVLEEEFHHLRYAVRDLDHLDPPARR
jgi:hypothetical protein